MALNQKQFPSEIVNINRSEITLCDYNPRQIDDEGRKALRRSLKKFGVLGGIIVNRRGHPDFTDGVRNVVCSGNQKVAILDAVNKYVPGDPGADYELRVELVDVDLKTEKEIVVVMNNQNVGGQWDYDKLREIIPDIDYKNVGFTDVDLSMIGCDFMFQTESETATTDALFELMRPDADAHQAELEQRRFEREAMKAQQQSDMPFDAGENDDIEDDDGSAPTKPGLSYEERKQQMKDLKKSVMERAIDKASDMDAYFMVTFTKWQDKAAFLQHWGYDPQSKFIKGEDFQSRLDGYEGMEG